ncbi:hypothetical protein CON01_01050 [Bacillus thuringiensis]|uniref:Uncharacterized protein n=1 Tax=Bacillus thuringiensis TaxID=1428 RepID=A0A9X6U4Q6_BACTU|nr:hypothetical protein [Bacillus thuringiensis]PED16469.1 hypothetical protein CON01_01050 [Bacillus thuringiensis]PGO85231.1 hypothetical protein CN990_21340 [Bacillus thuringiensis]
MKKMLKKLVKVGFIGLIFAMALTGKKMEIDLSENKASAQTFEIPAQDTSKDNIFMQEFKYEGEKENGYFKLNNIHDNEDFVWVDAEDMDYHLPMVGQNVIVQFNHDDVEIVYVQNLQTVQGTYTVVNANEKGIENFDNEKYVFVVNDFDENDTMVLENDGSYKTGDKVNIAMKISSSIDDIVDIQKVEKEQWLIK